jgi:anti-sigma-K factor RskA
MTAPVGAGHMPYEELAAGYALDALEPEDEGHFLVHHAGCAACSELIAEFRQAASNLVLLAEAVEPPPRLAGAIRAAAAEPGMPAASPGPPLPSAVPPATQAPPARMVRLRLRHWAHRSQLVALAAAAALLAGGLGTTVALRGGTRPTSVVGDCAGANVGCHRLVLADAASHRSAAVLLVRDGVAYLVPSTLPADNPATQTYVLWQVTGQHTPLAVASFDVQAGDHAPIRVGRLAAPFSDTWGFAVSLERGRVIPPSPSRPVALGTVSA